MRCISHSTLADTVVLLPPHIERIANLELTGYGWADIRGFSAIYSEPLPPRTLNINIVWSSWSGSDVVTSLSRRLFSGAVNLKEFRLHSEVSPFLSHFVFPNLTSFELSVTLVEEFRGSELLDFLEASPMLQSVDVKILTNLSLEGIPRERVVVLRNVESLCLTASDGGPGYKLATHLSCPSVKSVSFTYMRSGEHGGAVPLDVFPTSDSLNAIIHQYKRSPIEEVRFETTTYVFTTRSLILRSSDATVIKLRFQVVGDRDETETFSCGVFSRACRTIRDLPRLADIKHLHIYGLDVDWESTKHIAREFGGVLESLGPLEELAIRRCDMRSYFPYYPEIVRYPPIKVLTLSDPRKTLDGDVVKGLVRLAKAQHEIGVPFERVTIRSHIPPVDMEKLRPWVGVVDCVLYGGSE